MIHPAHAVAHVLPDIPPQKPRHAELLHLPRVHHLVAQQYLHLGRRQLARDPDAVPERDGHDVTRQQQTREARQRRRYNRHRRSQTMKRMFAFAAAMLVTTAVFAQQQDFSKVEIKVQKVQGTVYMLTGAGGNIGVSVGDDGIVIVADEFAPPAPKVTLPVITFNDTATIHVNGEDIKAVHFPHGHTDGDSVIFFTKSNVVHMGDDLFFAQFPFIDLDNGGSVRGLIKNLDKIMPMLDDDTKLIAGHGGLGA